jgi:hypothetical protein
LTATATPSRVGLMLVRNPRCASRRFVNSFTPAVAGLPSSSPSRHAAGPEHVVGDEEPARAQVRVREVDHGRIAVLVDVVVDDVPRRRPPRAGRPWPPRGDRSRGPTPPAR